MTKKKSIAVFNDITREMQGVVMQLAQVEQQIKSQANVPDEKIAEYMMSQFEAAMRQVEAKVYEVHNTNEQEVQKSAKEFENDEEFKAAVLKLQKLYAAISGQAIVTADVPAHLTMEKMMTVMEKLFEGMTAAMEEIVAAVKAEHGDNPSREVLAQAIGKEYGPRIMEVRKKINASFGISQEELQAGLMKYQREPEFAAKMDEITQQQKEKLVELGVTEE